MIESKCRKYEVTNKNVGMTIILNHDDNKGYITYDGCSDKSTSRWINRTFETKSFTEAINKAQAYLVKKGWTATVTDKVYRNGELEGTEVVFIRGVDY